jgi:aminomethyltransferase
VHHCAGLKLVSDTYNSDVEPADTVELLPLDAWHRARGARLVPFAGYAMPIQYEGSIAEHLWTRAHAGLFDVSHMGQLQLSGDGVAAALERLVPGDIAGLGIGRMRYSLLLGHDGGILDDLMVTNTGQGLYVVVNGAVKWDDIGFFREHLPDEITLHHMDEFALLALQGPEAADALACIGIEPQEAGWPLPTDLQFMEAGPFRWRGIALGISRSGYTGEDGFEISVPAEHAVALAAALCAQPEVEPIGLGARDSLRLEAGLPLYGHDLSEAIDPVEAQLTFAIQKRRRVEGGFNGAERILGHLAAGPPVKRVGFTVAGKLPVREGAEVFVGDIKVGTVTSGGFAPSLDHPVGMALVDAAYAIAGSALEADVRGRRVPVTVASMPFIPHRYNRRSAA